MVSSAFVFACFGMLLCIGTRSSFILQHTPGSTCSIRQIEQAYIARYGVAWSFGEMRVLIGIWGDTRIQSQLEGAVWYKGMII